MNYWNITPLPLLITMSKIKTTYASPKLTNQIEQIKKLGYELVAMEYENSIARTISKGWALYHIEQEIETELNRILSQESTLAKRYNICISKI